MTIFFTKYKNKPLFLFNFSTISKSISFCSLRCPDYTLSTNTDTLIMSLVTFRRILFSEYRQNLFLS
jgi:hypothetical protein